MIFRLINFFAGFVKISICGAFTDIFFADCQNAGIRLFDVRQIDGKYLCRVSISDYKKLRKIRRKSQVSIRIVKKWGLRFVAFHNRHRVGLVIGAVLGVVFLAFASTRVWSIKIIGCESIDQSRVFEVLEKLEVRVGMNKYDIDSHKLHHQLALQMPEIVWSAFNLNGSVLTVEIDERTFSPETINNKHPCNIVADFEGIIESIEVLKGVSQVTVGSAVREGDLLVSGISEYSNGNTAFLHSQAKITARTNDEISVSVKKNEIKAVRTGNQKTLWALEVYGKGIPLYLHTHTFTQYEKETEIKAPDINGTLLPLKLIEVTFFETEQKTVTISDEEAHIMLKEMIETAEKERLQNAEIIEKEEIFSENEDTVTLTVRYVLKKSMGTPQEITVSP